MLNILGLGTFPPNAGGSALSFVELLEGFGKLGHRIRVLTPTAESALGNLPCPGEHSPYIEVTRFPVPFVQNYGNIPASVDYRTIEGGSVRNLLPHVIENERPDLIMVGRETFASYVPDIAQHYQIPFIQRVSGGAALGILRREYPPDLATSLIDALKRANVVVTPARHLSERMKQLGLPDVKVIPNAIDLDRFSPGQPSRELQCSLGITDNDCVVAHISNFNVLKRAMDIARSAERALKKNPSLLYLFVGDGGERPLIEAKFRDLGLSERSRFPGWVPYGRIHEYYRLAAITVMPAEDETQARAYLEAQACGRVLIASDIPAAREVVVDGETGALFPKGNIDALTELIVSLAADPARRAALGQKARAAMSRRGLDDAVLSYLKLFNSTLAVSKASRE